MSPLSKRVIAGGALLVLIACGGDGATGPSASVHGTYALKTINGQAMPVTLGSGSGYTFKITSGSFTLNANGTFSNTGTYQETTGSTTVTETQTCTGTYTKNGNSLAFNEAASANTDCGGLYNGTWDGANRLTVAFDAQIQAVLER